MANGHGGKREGAGRQKGSQNRTTTQVKEAILEAFEKAGGPNYLLTVAKENPAVFCQLIGKVIPKDMDLNLGVQDSLANLLKQLDGTAGKISENEEIV